MRPGRMLRHLFTAPAASGRVLSDAALERIRGLIAASERLHGGQIVVAVEAALPWSYLKRGASARERAVMQFSKLRVWDTENNNGVLLYLLLADRDVEIVADRGIASRVEPAAWEGLCRRMEAAFRAGRFEQGVSEGVQGIAELLARHFPRAAAPGAEQGNELPDAPVRL
jgi:uncharacterized membrane protein